MKCIRLAFLILMVWEIVFCAVAYGQENWIIPAGNEPFISEVFDGGDANKLFKTEAITVEVNRIRVLISSHDATQRAALYVAYLRPEDSSDDCREFYSLWFCAEKAKLSEALPALYLEWISKRNIDAERLKGIFSAEPPRDVKSVSSPPPGGIHNYFEEHRGLVMKQFFILWFVMMLSTISVALKREARSVFMHSIRKPARVVRIITLLLAGLAMVAAICFISQHDFAMFC